MGLWVAGWGCRGASRERDSERVVQTQMEDTTRTLPVAQYRLPSTTVPTVQVLILLYLQTGTHTSTAGTQWPSAIPLLSYRQQASPNPAMGLHCLRSCLILEILRIWGGLLLLHLCKMAAASAGKYYSMC